MWPDFCEMVSLRFTPILESPEPELDGNELRLERFFELAHRWGPIANETMETYVRHFERDLVEEYPYVFPEEEKCRLLWQGVPKHIQDVACFHENDYYHLCSKVLYAELGAGTQSDKRPRKEDSPLRSIR